MLFSLEVSLVSEVIIKAVLYDLFESVKDLCRKMTTRTGLFVVSRLKMLCLSFSTIAVQIVYFDNPTELDKFSCPTWKYQYSERRVKRLVEVHG